MAFGNIPVDGGGIQMGVTYVQGIGFVVLQGSTNILTDGQGNQSTPLDININSIGDLNVQMAGTDGLPAGNLQQVVHGRFNGMTVDMDRGNEDTIQLINASQLTTTQTAQYTNHNARGCIVIFKTTNIGTGNLTLTINGVEPLSAYTWQILSGVAVSTNTTNMYKVYPGLSGVTNQVVSDVLPRTFNVTVTANNANPADYVVNLILVL